jgi:hypothetical protein
MQPCNRCGVQVCREGTESAAKVIPIEPRLVDLYSISIVGFLRPQDPCYLLDGLEAQQGCHGRFWVEKSSLRPLSGL